eukprot:GEMP01009236.1.p1 GENE.GEMP01009236.1~~GEMP01009236.1.p1  ORF type:complete len:992 (+),score=200.63 GEMP01009236.1:28-3003(+)
MRYLFFSLALAVLQVLSPEAQYNVKRAVSLRYNHNNVPEWARNVTWSVLLSSDSITADSVCVAVVVPNPGPRINVTLDAVTSQTSKAVSGTIAPYFDADAEYADHRKRTIVEFECTAATHTIVPQGSLWTVTMTATAGADTFQDEERVRGPVVIANVLPEVSFTNKMHGTLATVHFVINVEGLTLEENQYIIIDPPDGFKFQKYFAWRGASTGTVLPLYSCRDNGYAQCLEHYFAFKLVAVPASMPVEFMLKITSPQFALTDVWEFRVSAKDDSAKTLGRGIWNADLYIPLKVEVAGVLPPYVESSALFTLSVDSIGAERNVHTVTITGQTIFPSNCLVSGLFTCVGGGGILTATLSRKSCLFAASGCVFAIKVTPRAGMELTIRVQGEDARLYGGTVILPSSALPVTLWAPQALIDDDVRWEMEVSMRAIPPGVRESPRVVADGPCGKFEWTGAKFSTVSSKCNGSGGYIETWSVEVHNAAQRNILVDAVYSLPSWTAAKTLLEARAMAASPHRMLIASQIPQCSGFCRIVFKGSCSLFAVPGSTLLSWKEHSCDDNTIETEALQGWIYFQAEMIIPTKWHMQVWDDGILLAQNGGRMESAPATNAGSMFDCRTALVVRSADIPEVHLEPPSYTANGFQLGIDDATGNFVITAGAKIIAWSVMEPEDMIWFSPEGNALQIVAYCRETTANVEEPEEFDYDLIVIIAIGVCSTGGIIAVFFVYRRRTEYYRRHTSPSSFQLAEYKAHACPEYWNSYPVLKAKNVHFQKLNQKDTSKFQALMDKTFVAIRTRDRALSGCSEMPVGLLVDHILRVENSVLWNRYKKARGNMAIIKPEHATPSRILDRWKEIDLPDAEMWYDTNETYLFHGTSNESCDALAVDGFDIAHAGTVGGSLYGKGFYGCEMVSKADEYATEKEGMCSIAVLRVSCGRTLVVPVKKPDYKYLAHMVQNKRVDCVLGDREYARGTYREWVVYDPALIYCEYIVRYRRRYN